MIIAHGKRSELEQWQLSEGIYQEQPKIIASKGYSMATMDSIMAKRLELIAYDSDICNDVTSADGLAVYNGLIKLDLNSEHLRNTENKDKKDGAIILTEDDFYNIKGRAFEREQAKGMLYPNKDDIIINSLWLRLSRYQINTLRKYFKAVSEKCEGNAMRIILPQDSSVPSLYPLKLGKVESESFLTVQYLDEKAIVASTRLWARFID